MAGGLPAPNMLGIVTSLLLEDNADVQTALARVFKRQQVMDPTIAGAPLPVPVAPRPLLGSKFVFSRDAHHAKAVVENIILEPDSDVADQLVASAAFEGACQLVLVGDPERLLKALQTRLQVHLNAVLASNTDIKPNLEPDKLTLGELLVQGTRFGFAPQNGRLLFAVQEQDIPLARDAADKNGLEMQSSPPARCLLAASHKTGPAASCAMLVLWAKMVTPPLVTGDAYGLQQYALFQSIEEWTRKNHINHAGYNVDLTKTSNRARCVHLLAG